MVISSLHPSSAFILFSLLHEALAFYHMLSFCWQNIIKGQWQHTVWQSGIGILSPFIRENYRSSQWTVLQEQHARKRCGLFGETSSMACTAQTAHSCGTHSLQVWASHLLPMVMSAGPRLYSVLKIIGNIGGEMNGDLYCMGKTVQASVLSYFGHWTN